MNLETIRGIVLLALGFGFVIFWHELGHFLAAKWAGVKVEQFAVGFGQAVLAWRKGLGLRIGTTTPEFLKRIRAHLVATGGRTFEGDESPTELEIAHASKELAISETEYRLNWMPLGGYVKMLGQDDMRPNSEAEDPRAYNRQSVGKRMIIISAGVVMNVILAAIGFIVLFMIGFHVPPARVGMVLPGSPAQRAGLHVGDRILSIDGKAASDDWTKVQLNVALADREQPMEVVVERLVNGKPEHLKLEVTPELGSGMTKDILGLGIGQAYELKAPVAKTPSEAAEEDPRKNPKLTKMGMPDSLALRPGDVITAVNGQPVALDDDAKFNQILQESNGQPLHLTVRTPDGKTEQREVQPRFVEPFGRNPQLSFAGMLPRVQISFVSENSPALGWVMPGDVVESLSTGKEQQTIEHPSPQEFSEHLKKATVPVQMDVLRLDGQEITIKGLGLTSIDPHTRGLGVGLGYDDLHAVVADTVKGSAAELAHIPGGARLTRIAGKPVTSWFDVRRILLDWLKDHPVASATAAPVPVEYVVPDKGIRGHTMLALSADEANALQSYRYSTQLALGQPRAERKAPNAWVAVKWGVTETRDFILQFYLTLRRMVTGGVPAEQAMGPIGIFQAGKTFAERGTDWLIWFLAMISANLAVVNFLPIPIVDGGHFVFLLLEKIKGKPLSAKTQIIAQYVGLALLVGVFLFVTYQDILWLPFRGGR